MAFRENNDIDVKLNNVSDEIEDIWPRNRHLRRKLFLWNKNQSTKRWN